MFDLLLRALRHPISYSGVIRNNKLTLKKVVEEETGAKTFHFEKPPHLHWRAGQHGVFTLPGKKVSGKKWRAFSVASTPNEQEVIISTTFPPEPSSFKQALLTLQPGDKITMWGPFGEFHLDKNTTTAVAIAGGIGVTPIRALLKEVSESRKDVHLYVIYAGRDSKFAFHELCSQLDAMPNITISFVNSADEVNAEIDKKVSELGNNASYFVSGSPGMISAVITRLKSAGIKKIVNDPFKGY